jgi:hypothetical protein
MVAHLRDPREKIWGILLALETPGLWIRGVDVNSFEDWARQVGKDGDGFIAPSTLFLPFLRVEKLVLDEPLGPVLSMAQRLEQMAGITAETALEGFEAGDGCKGGPLRPPDDVSAPWLCSCHSGPRSDFL